MNKIVKDILEKLESLNYEAYIVGGYVRDSLLGVKSNDYDICTNAPIKEVMKYFPGKVSLDSSLNIKINEINIDITTYRFEGEYHGRIPTLSYTNNLIDDLKRRDFTINTICMDKEGKIKDLLNGQEDLNNHLIKVVNNTESKIKEDPLRILRAIRFATVLDFSLDEELETNIKKYGYLLDNLSTYRIKEELSKIIISPNYKKGLNYLKEFNLNKYLGINYTNVVYTSDLCGMWSQLDISKDFPFTKTEKNNILMVKEILADKIITNETIYKYGLYNSLVAARILGIEKNSIQSMANDLPIYKKSDLAITFLEIQNLINGSAILTKKVEREIIHLVLKKQLENNKEVIKKYILENKMRFLNE